MTLYLGIAIVFTAMAVGGFLIWWVSKKSPEGSLADRIPTNVYAVTAGAMSLLAAFTFSAAFAEYTNAQQAVRAESSAILQMYRATSFMEQPLQTSLRNDLLCYAQLVSTVEWSALAAGDTSPQGSVQQTMMAMDNALANKDGFTQAGNGFSVWETGNTNLAMARQQRYAAADWNVPPIVYILIIVGSLITITSLFTFADRTKPGWGHVLVIIGPVFVAVASLVVIMFFDSPFIETPGSVTPAPILDTVQYIQEDLESRGLDPNPSCPTDTGSSTVFPAQS